MEMSSKHQHKPGHELMRARAGLHAETLGGPLACSVALVRSARAGAAPAAPRRAAPRDRAAGARRPIGQHTAGGQPLRALLRLAPRAAARHALDSLISRHKT